MGVDAKLKGMSMNLISKLNEFKKLIMQSVMEEKWIHFTVYSISRIVIQSNIQSIDRSRRQ